MKKDTNAVKKSRLRAINNGTRYDVAGKLKWLARQIERGERGDIRNVVVCAQEITNGGGVSTNTYHFGTGDLATVHHLIECAKKDLT